MKKKVCLILNLLIIHMYCFSLSGFAQNINIDKAINLDTNVTSQSIKFPQTLPKWAPPPPEPPYYPNVGPVPPTPPTPPGPPPTPPGPPTPGGGGDSPSHKIATSKGGSSMAMVGVALGVGIPVVVGGGLLGLFLSRKHAPVTLPPVIGGINPTLPAVSNNANKTSFDFNFGEEILYYLAFNNDSQSPIYNDSVLYIKIPTWLDYIPESTILNNVKLTDEADDDILTYYKDDSLIVINIGVANQEPSLAINFGAKVLTQSVSKSEAFCEVKFQSVKYNYSTEWNKMSVYPEKTLPPVLEKILTNQ